MDEAPRIKIAAGTAVPRCLPDPLFEVLPVVNQGPKIWVCVYILYIQPWWYTYPSEKYESQLGLLFPIYGKIKHIYKHIVLNIASLILGLYTLWVFNIAMENGPFIDGLTY